MKVYVYKKSFLNENVDQILADDISIKHFDGFADRFYDSVL